MAAATVLAALLPACDRGGQPESRSAPRTVTLVNRMTASAQGVTCVGCAAQLEAALGQQLDPATITIGPRVERIDVEFHRSASPFSSASFRRAVGAVGGEVLSVQIDACGTIETTQEGSWMTSGSSRLLLEGRGPWMTGTELCVTGELRDESIPARLVVGRIGS